MRVSNLLIMSMLTAAASSVSFAADSDVEKCIQQKTEAYPGNTLFNQRQRCMPIAAVCWGWGGGESSVYEYCSEDALNNRGKDVNPADQNRKRDWDCGGSKSSC